LGHSLFLQPGFSVASIVTANGPIVETYGAGLGIVGPPNQGEHTPLVRLVVATTGSRGA
jgi:hypothetical protein